MNCKIIIVNSIGQFNKSLNKRLNENKITQPETGLVMTPEVFNKVFSPERIKLMKRINQNNITSIYQLAKELDKPYEVVFRNLQYLQGMGLVKIKKKEKKRIPCLTGRLVIDMFGSEIEA